MYKQLFTIILVLASMLPASLWAQTAGAAEAYAALSEDVTGSMTLTFYYDDQRIDRNGFGIGPFADDETKGWDSVIANIISVVFDNSFADYVDLTSTAHWFDGMENLMTITGISNLNTSNVTSMAAMFRNCSSLTSLDLSGLNTSNVWRVWSMFSGCTSMESINVSSWNTEKFSNMGRLFENCSALTTLDLSHFNTSQATAMSNMFYNDSSLITIYASEGWNVEGVTESSDMFHNCINLRGGRGTIYSADHVKATYAHIDGGEEYPGYLTDINAPTSCPITIKVVGFGSVTAAGTTVVSGDEQNIDVMPGTSLIMAFTPSDGYRLGTVMVDTTNVTSQVIADSTGVSYYTLLSIYDAHSVTVTFVNDAPEAYAALNGDNTVLTFYYDKQKEERNGMDIGPFTQMSERGWQSNSTSITRVVFDESFADAPPVTSVDYWFFSMQQLTDIEGLQYLNTSEVTNMSWMFQHCSSLTALDLSPLNTQKVTNMMYMFAGCTSLTSVDLSNFNTGNVMNMSYMFQSCNSLTNLNLSSFNTQNVTDMTAMFSNCAGLTSLYLNTFDTQNVTNMSNMFTNCSSLTSLDLANFNTAKVTNMSGMFYGCSALTTIYAGENWMVSSGVNDVQMFFDCTSLVGSKGTTYDNSHVDATYAHIDGGTANPGYFTDKNSIEIVGNTDLSSAWWTAFSSNYEIPANYTLHMQFVNHSAKANNWDNWVMLCTADSTRTPEYFALRADRYGWGDYHNADGFTTNWEDWDAFREAMDGALVDFTVRRWGSEVKVTSISKATDGTELIQTYTTTVAPAESQSVNVFLTVENAYLEIYKNSISLTPSEAPVEPYAVLSEDSLTVTFYYDDQKASRGGMAINSSYISSYSGERNPYGTAVTAIIDDSFANYTSLSSTACWFMECNKLTEIKGLGNLNTANVTDMHDMFFGCSNLTSLDVSGFNTANVTDMHDMFFRCSNLTSLDVSGFNTANVTNMREMFAGCFVLTSLDVGGFNTANVTDMGDMFGSCSGLTSLDVSGFNTANVTDMYGMFYGCSGLTSLDVSGFNTASVTDMSLMFHTCFGLTSLDLSGFNTANVTEMNVMFAGCSGLTSLVLSGFNTANVTDMDGMFIDCSSLTTIYVGEGWSTAAVSESNDMFGNCTALVGGQGTTYDSSHTDHTYAHIDGGTQNPGYLTLYLTMGDANGDGDVNIADAVATVTNILGQTATDNFYSYAADMNGDGEIDIFDVTLIVSAVFNAASPAPAYSRAGGVAAEDVQLTAQGNRVMMGIEKEGQYTAFQFDVTLPEGTELEGVSLASASTNHQLSFQKRQGNTYRVIGLSMTNEQLAAANGRLVQLQLSDNAGEKNVKMSNVIFVGQPATDATAIRNYVSDGAADRDAIYDLNGRYVGTDKSRLTKGIYIINHKKVNIK